MSTRTQDVAAQVAQLRDAGCVSVRTESTSRATRRPVLDVLVDDLGPGDRASAKSLVTW